MKLGKIGFLSVAAHASLKIVKHGVVNFQIQRLKIPSQILSLSMGAIGLEILTKIHTTLQMSFVELVGVRVSSSVGNLVRFVKTVGDRLIFLERHVMSLQGKGMISGGFWMHIDEV